jgi:heme/copper-type cytochrome/quinol oxidase subunit 1
LQLKTKPYHFLLVAGIAFILLYLLFFSNTSTIDIHLHDTYFIIAFKHICALFAIVAFGFWLLYICTKKLMHSQALVWVHVSIVVVTLFTAAITLYFMQYKNGMARSYNDFSNLNSPLNSVQVQILGIALLAFFCGQMFYVVNLFRGVLRLLSVRN